MSESSSVCIATVGLGYVGLPLALLFAQTGHIVIGIDTDAGKVSAIRRGMSHISDVRDDELEDCLTNHGMTVESEFERACEADVIVICVPTPLTDQDTPDLSYLQTALTRLLPYIHRSQLIVVESSTYPGTTEEIVVPMIERTGLTVGDDVFVAYSPERIDPGQNLSLQTIPKIVGGMTPACSQRIQEVYGTVFEHVLAVSNARTAEMIKVVENAYRYVNISFVNELSTLCRAMDIDVWEVIEGASSKPFGYTPFYPGPGVGGHCIPVDPLYLKWKADQLGVRTGFIELAHAVNRTMPDTVVQLLTKALDMPTVKGQTIFVVGVTYKKNVNDVRESPALKIISRLLQSGAHVQFHDPMMSSIQVDDHALHSVEPTDEVLQNASAVLILTDHDGVNYERIVQHARLVVDTRNVTRFDRTHRIVRL